jgi:hypothetical protein
MATPGSQSECEEGWSVLLALYCALLLDRLLEAFAEGFLA